MTETTNTPEMLPQAISAAKSELSGLHTGMVENILTQALPVPDLVFGGSILILVIMFHAFWIRLITSQFLKRVPIIRSLALMWSADLGFALTIMALLALHLTEVLIWSAALIFGNIVGDWARAAYFTANCYTALGEPFSLPHTWRMLPPIIAISGIFTFAWTASVLVDFVARYNTLRADILTRHRGHLVEKEKAQ